MSKLKTEFVDLHLNPTPSRKSGRIEYGGFFV